MNLGLDVREGDFEGRISGFLYQDGARTVIGINRSHGAARRRFTLAHEIGHYMLHSRTTTFVDHATPPTVLRRDTKSSEGTDAREVEANTFAAELLMPANFIAHDFETIDLATEPELLIQEFAQRYDVSVQAMTIRLVRLGHLEDPAF
ncbi:ImmA/IrrE family metallo-endopeptidase (plasmid) [Deinococcus radiomollis]|uniref:ImmA/IrrE family metallo-endopeptidase n=1 Tax=Deinococcus radiomollis TaxID=468916 RepID=UPI0038919AAE